MDKEKFQLYLFNFYGGKKTKEIYVIIFFFQLLLTLLAFISHITLQIIQLYLQLPVYPLGLCTLSAIYNENEDNDQEEETAPRCNACNCFCRKCESFWDIIFNPTNIKLQIIYFDLKVREFKKIIKN